MLDALGTALISRVPKGRGWLYLRAAWLITVLCMFTSACQGPGAASPSPSPSQSPSSSATAAANITTPAVPTHAVGDTILTTRARARSWQLAPDSPFSLVGEGLRDAYINALDGKVFILSDPCGVDSASSRGFRVGDSPYDVPPFWTTIRPVDGDHFAASALPPSPTQSGSRIAAFALEGHWPNDVWLHYMYGVSPSGPRDRFFQLTGSRWSTIPDGDSLYPAQIFDWFDGAHLVAQRRSWGVSQSTFVEPFLVLGASSHRPPDFSGLAFPRDQTREVQNANVSYAMLPTREVFAMHHIYLPARNESVVSVARATPDGQVSLDRAFAGRGIWSSPFFSSGRLGSRDVLVLGGDERKSGKHRAWLRVYDRSSATDIPPPGGALSNGDLTGAWLAGGQLWARRDASVWRYDEGSWSKLAKLHSSAILSAERSTGTLWSIFGSQIARLDTSGQMQIVPFLGEGSRGLIPAEILPIAPGDVWLRALGAPDETLLFRTKKMTSILTCEGPNSGQTPGATLAP